MQHIVQHHALHPFKGLSEGALWCLPFCIYCCECYQWIFWAVHCRSKLCWSPASIAAQCAEQILGCSIPALQQKVNVLNVDLHLVKAVEDVLESGEGRNAPLCCSCRFVWYKNYQLKVTLNVNNRTFSRSNQLIAVRIARNRLKWLIRHSPVASFYNVAWCAKLST